MLGWGRHVPAYRERIIITNSYLAKGMHNPLWEFEGWRVRKFFTEKGTLDVRSVGEGGGHQAKTVTYFRERKEFNVTGLKVVWVRVMGCEAEKRTVIYQGILYVSLRC